MSEEVKEPQVVETPTNEFEIEKSGRNIEPPKEEVEEKPEQNDNDQKEVGTEDQPKKKSRAQTRIEKLSKEKRELAKELQELKSEKESKNSNDDLDPDDFEDYDAYLDAVTNNTETEKSTNKKPESSSNDDFQEVLDSIESKFDETRDKYEDFDELVQKQPEDGGPHITLSMVEAINEVDNSGEVAYELAKNINESIRISKLSPIKQVIAIDKLSSKLEKTAGQPTKEVKTTNAPEPINAIGGGEVVQKTLAGANNFSDYESMRTAENKKQDW